MNRMNNNGRLELPASRSKTGLQFELDWHSAQYLAAHHFASIESNHANHRLDTGTIMPKLRSIVLESRTANVTYKLQNRTICDTSSERVPDNDIPNLGISLPDSGFTSNPQIGGE